MRVFSWLSFLSFLCISLNAAITVPINSTNLIKCTFSSKHHNRILVEGQRIKKIFYQEGEILIRMEEDTGQMFVQAMVENPSDATISLVTNEGLVQDLELSFIHKSSEILILYESNPIEEDCGPAGFSYEDDMALIQHAIEALMKGETPDEYVPVENNTICFQLKKHIQVKSYMQLIGPVYTITCLLAENQGRFCDKISERELNCLNGEWVFAERDHLKKYDKMLVLIGERTDER